MLTCTVQTDENARQIIQASHGLIEAELKTCLKLTLDVHQGHMDTSLNANGVFQAEITRDYLKAKGVKPDVCWSSPLKRARRASAAIKYAC